MQRGFTLVELLIVIGVLMTVFSVSMPIGSNWYNLNNFDSAVGMIVSSLRKAQTYAIDKKDNAAWGVCLTGDTVRLFSGSCVSPTIKNDYQLPSDVSVTGLTTVTFSQLRGEPSTPQSVVVSGSGKSKTININLLGGLDIN